jgi:hypothetical protein
MEDYYKNGEGMKGKRNHSERDSKTSNGGPEEKRRKTSHSRGKQRKSEERHASCDDTEHHYIIRLGESLIPRCKEEGRSVGFDLFSDKILSIMGEGEVVLDPLRKKVPLERWWSVGTERRRDMLRSR